MPKPVFAKNIRPFQVQAFRCSVGPSPLHSIRRSAPHRTLRATTILAMCVQKKFSLQKKVAHKKLADIVKVYKNV